MRKTKETLTLECILTEKQRMDYAKEMALNYNKKTAAENQLKAFKSSMNDIIDGCDAKISELNRKVDTGKEYREVNCEIDYDFDKKTKTWTRTDTKEICKDDIITEYELQEEMNFQQKQQEKANKAAESDEPKTVDQNYKEAEERRNNVYSDKRGIFRLVEKML
jgi:hypothetical protein